MFGIITTAAYVHVKTDVANAIAYPLYVLYGYGFGCNIASWIMGFFSVLLLAWPIVDEYPHVLSPYLPTVPPPLRKHASSKQLHDADLPVVSEDPVDTA